DTFGAANRRPIFGGRGGRRIAMDLQASDFSDLLEAGLVGFINIPQVLEGANVRPQPALELAEPELRLVPDDRRIAELGWTRNDVATLIRAFGDGAFLGDYFDGDRRLDVIMRGEGWSTPEELMAMPLATPSGRTATLGELTRLERTAGPNSIRRVDRSRTLTLSITPPPGMPMETALTILETEVEPLVRAALPPDGIITYRGTAEALNETLANLAGSFLLAIVILYLLISALFRSFKDSLLVLLTIPMATVGGIVALRIVDAIFGQPMDMLTMIGFVILLGLVVNNAILLVYRARDAEREGKPRREAVREAVALRLRPILMSTFTSLFGMLPLLLIPGAGTELYRGLAAVIIGGLGISTLFTLILLPSLLRVNEEAKAVNEQRDRETPGGAEGQYA
ncbi:MAG: efflux RND transporter permease subunit, partial [Pseudomonadota bacterium]